MKKEYAERYGDYSRNHWWFRARRDVFHTLLISEIAWRERMEVLEIGVGSGENLYSLYPDNVQLSGLEPEPENAELSRQRGPVPVYTGTLESLPPPLAKQTFDVVTMFDVLEHIEDDWAALDILHDKLNSDGYLALSVPAHMWMWGQQDVVNKHYRRYRKKELVNKLLSSGFTIQRITYFNSYLFPLIATFRIAARLRPLQQETTHSDFEYTMGPIDGLFYRIFSTEAAWLAKHSFAWGCSLFVVARRCAGKN